MRMKILQSGKVFHSAKGPFSSAMILLENTKANFKVILRDMPLDERKNAVAHVVKEELFLLDYIKPWGTFRLIK